MAIPAELRVETIMAAFEKFASEPQSKLAKYFSPMGAENGGNFVKYDVLEYNRAMLDMVAYDAKAPLTDYPVRTVVSFEAPTYKQRIDILPSLLKGVRDVGSLSNSQQATIARAVRQCALNLERRQNWLRAQWLTGGACLSSAGVAPIEPTGIVYLDTRFGKTSTPQAISLGFTASHIDAGATASWATAGTDIKADIDAARVAIMADGGVDARRIILNSKAMGYIYNNTGSGEKSEIYKAMYDKSGEFTNLWGYEFDVIDEVLPFDATSMATDTGATGYIKAIPDEVVIITTADNMAAGRYMIECEPSDVNAPSNARGAFAWQDGDWEHPHVPQFGVEWTGAPAIVNVDSQYIYTKVTDTS